MNNSTPLMTYVWSPADGRLILRDAVALQLSSDTGLSTIVANRAGGIQRLYPLTDALGSVVAIVQASMADPNNPGNFIQTTAANMVQERYVYTVDGTPQAINANWTVRTGVDGMMLTASTLGWNWLYRGEEWEMTHPQATYSQGVVPWDGLYMSSAGQQWYDSFHARNLQPNLAAYADPQGRGAYTALETFGATAAPVLAGIGVGILAAMTAGAALPLLGFGLAGGGLTAGGTVIAGSFAGAAGTAAWSGSSSFVAGGSAGQVVRAAAIGGVAGALGGATGGLAGLGARSVLAYAGAACGPLAGFAVGAAEGGAFGATQGFVQTGLMTGNLVDAVMAGWNGALMGAAIGGPLGGIFHDVCFVKGTQLVLEMGGGDHAEPLAGEVRHARGGVATLNRIRHRTKNVEHVRKGEFVASRDENDPNGPMVYRRVTEVYRRLADHLRNLTIQDFEGRIQDIGTTDEHPFQTGSEKWTAAKDLKIGDILIGRRGGCATVVATVREEHPEGVEVFNFRIEGTHTYFVRGKGSDAEPVWVHNRCVVGDFQKDEVSSDLIRQWAGQFESRAAIGEEGVQWHDFQVENVGPQEVLVQGGGAEVWADGVNNEEGLLQEAKFASNPYNSPYVPGSGADAEVRDLVEARLDAQLQKYAAIVNDPYNPIRGLQMITNNEGTAQWLAQKMGQHGIPGYVDVVQGGSFSTTGQPL